MGPRISRNKRVVLAGRPNVGKSTLFNRMVGGRRAIVTPVAGTTRDVIREPVEWLGIDFELVDTGGVFGGSGDPLHAEVTQLGVRELDSAAVVVVLVDAVEGIVPADIDVVRQVRLTGCPVVLAVNKVDDAKYRDRVSDFYELAIDPMIPIAAEHGLGIGDLLDEIVARLPQKRANTESSAGDDNSADTLRELQVAIVGRPNVGKSSLLNRLTNEDRMLVNETAGTTRDAVDSFLQWHGRRIRLVDTAGIRKPGKVTRAGQMESVSVVVAKRALKRADVALLLIDATSGVTKQDAAIAGEAERAGCGVIVVANKWDLVKSRGADYVKTFDADLRDDLKFIDYAPILHVSALTGERARNVLGKAVEVTEARATHVSTAELNRLVDRITVRHRPHSRGRKEVKILYATQVGSKPPTFTFFTNIATRFHFSYERYLRNQLRQAFGFQGSPIWLKVRSRREPNRVGRRN